MASASLPRALMAPSRSAFAVIDPVSERYSRILEPGMMSKMNLSGRLSSYFAISYVWTEWKESSEDKLPSWRLIRERLLQLSTTNLAAYINDGTIAQTARSLGFDLHTVQAEPFRCWIDCKCINQSSEADKRYWIPRMNEIFFNARCTILLLRDLDLTALYEICRITTCLFSDTSSGDEAKSGPVSHRCLFSPSCISLRSSIPPSLEELCLKTLEALWNGTWRKRAWIFQEILLSERYLLAWGDAASVAYMELGTVGYIAAFLQARHPYKLWLTDLWTWCKQCTHLREFYSDRCDMEATLLQLAEHLESTVPCDKYYALCGVLGLPDVRYDSTHSTEEALDNVIAALTRQGRMGWMYALPPGFQEGFVFSDQCMAPLC